LIVNPTSVAEDSTLTLLAQVPLLAGLPERDLAELAAASRANTFAPDAIIFNQGDPCDRVWILREGQVKIVHQSEEGRETILEIISPGEPFGGTVIFLPAHPATARAMTAAQTVSLSAETYRRLLMIQPVVAHKLIRLLAGRLQSLMSLSILTGERVERRLAHILVKLADRVGRPDQDGILITIPLSRQDLADMAGTTLETTIRTVSRFREQGLLKTRRGGYLVIADLAELQAHAAPAVPRLQNG
jgi:CRP-like cAMP-binding protein